MGSAGLSSNSALNVESKQASFSSEAQAKQAAASFGQRGARLADRKRILDQMRAAPELAVAAFPEFMKFFDRLEANAKHEVLDLALTLLDLGQSLTGVSDDLCRSLADSNTGLRDKVGGILIRMGADAGGGELRVLGCTRHALYEVRLLAVRVLGSIGSVCSPSARNRLKKLAQETKAGETELQEAAREALRKIENGAGGATETRRDDVRSATGVMLALKTLVDPQTDSETVAMQRAAIADAAPEARARGLVASLSADNPRARAVAARLLYEYRREVAALAGLIAQAFRKEEELAVKDCLADLLTLILLEHPSPSGDEL